MWWLWLILATTALSPEDVLYRYVRAVLADDWATARAGWWPADLARSEALGIRYRDNPLKVDDSPLLRLADGLRARTIQLEVAPPLARDGRAEISLYFVATDTLSHRMHLVQRDGRWWLSTPPTALSTGWPRRAGEFLEFVRSPDVPARPMAEAALDIAVGRMLERLEVGSARVEHLRREKLRYVITAPDDIATLARAETEGLANLQVDAVITRHPYHLHEVAHLVVAFALGEQDPAILPFFQEGLAVHLGGRWGRHARVFPPLGRFVLESGLVSLDQLLTDAGFRAQPADVSYPVAGTVVGYVVQRWGWPTMLALTRAVSADFPTVASWEEEDVHDAIHAVTGQAWPEFKEGLFDYLLQLGPAAIHPDPSLPESDRMLWELDKDGLALSLRDGPAAVSLTLPHPKLAGGASPLYGEHFGDRPFGGVRYVLRVDSEEAGVYDYATDTLVAKYVVGFQTEGPLAEDGVIRLRIDPQVVPIDIKALRLLR